MRVFQRRDGRDIDVAFLRAGDAAGEAALFADPPEEATVEALTGGTALELDRSAFERLLAAHESIRELVSERVSRYDYRAQARVPLDFAQEILPAEAVAQERASRAHIEALAGADAADAVADEWEDAFSRPRERSVAAGRADGSGVPRRGEAPRARRSCHLPVQLAPWLRGGLGCRADGSRDRHRLRRADPPAKAPSMRSSMR